MLQGLPPENPSVQQWLSSGSSAGISVTSIRKSGFMISPSFVRSLLGISRLRLVSIGVILTAAWVSMDISHPTLSTMRDSKKAGFDEGQNTPVSYSSRGVYRDLLRMGGKGRCWDTSDVFEDAGKDKPRTPNIAGEKKGQVPQSHR